MKFRQWFRAWIASFLKIIKVSLGNRKRNGKRKSRSAFGKSRFSLFDKKHRRRRSSYHAQNARLTEAILDFLATTLAVVLLPIGLLDWGRKSIRAKKASGRKSNTKSRSKCLRKKSSRRSGVARTSNKIQSKTQYCVPDTTESHVSDACLPTEDVRDKRGDSHDNVESDEGTPKSTPKSPSDIYIRKRMIIAGAHYCDTAALTQLRVGVRFDLEAEPDNPYDKDAVRLVYNGCKIGYVPREDALAFATCLKIGRSVYGIITDVNEIRGITEYEFETWFDSE